MKHLLNTLYVSTQGVWLSLEGETVRVSLHGDKLAQFPLINLQNIVCFGNVSCSPFLMGACAEKGTGIAFLTEHGRFLARIQGGVCGNVLLRKRQYAMSDDPRCVSSVASGFLLAKILNSRAALQRFLRDHGSALPDERIRVFQENILFFKKLSVTLNAYRHPARPAPEVAALRGMEGDAAARYFSLFPDLITSRKVEFPFTGRSKRPPLDPVNAVLSFLYTLLAHDVESALEAVGLDPAVGFLHALRPGRPSLALDLMEELRAFVADRIALALINLRQISPADFHTTETGAVLMSDNAKKTLLNAYQERKQDELVHPFLGESVKLGLLPYVQALLFARFVRGDLAAYPPFIAR